MTDMLLIHGAAEGDVPEILVFPADERWDEARQAWNLAVDQQPAAVAEPRTARRLRCGQVGAGARAPRRSAGHRP